MLHAQTKPGLVCTFYSYKGGVGRSMALANVAALLALWGRKVLAVDWDLEAPGLEKFFMRPGVRLIRDTPGLVDLITDFSADSERYQSRSETSVPCDGSIRGFATGETLDWRRGLLSTPIPRGQAIALLHAGCNDPEYLDRLRDIGWPALFERGLGNALERMRDEWREQYDFILVDSRTGITDIGGICTILLPDYVIAFFTANEQSLEGLRDTMHRVQKLRAALPVDRQTLVILPIPARDESNSEYQRAAEWRGRFAQALAPFYRDWIPKEETPERVLDYLKIPNVPFWSFGEQLPVLAEPTDNPKNLSYAYALIARLINGRLDWSEVREGGRQAMEAEAKQFAESEERAAKAGEATAKAAEAERLRREEQIDQLHRSVQARYDELVSRTARTVRLWRVVLSGLFAFGFIVVVGFVSLIKRPLDPFSASFFAFIFVGIVLSGGLLQDGRRRLRACERERLSLDIGNGAYRGLTALDALRLFARRIEAIRERNPLAEPVASTYRGLDLTAVTAVADAAAAAAPLTTVGRADVLVSYQRSPLTNDWERAFTPLFRAWLSEILGRDVVLSDDRSLKAGVDWHEWWTTRRPADDLSLRDWLSSAKARIALVIVSRRSVRSAWAGEELRDLLRIFGDGRLVVIALDRGAVTEIKELANYPVFDFSDLAYIGEGFVKSERYLDFQDRIRNLAERAAQMIEGSRRSERPSAATA
jgi:cellulose biosynthesis protein BcsQ